MLRPIGMHRSNSLTMGWVGAALFHTEKQAPVCGRDPHMNASSCSDAAVKLVESSARFTLSSPPQPEVPPGAIGAAARRMPSESRIATGQAIASAVARWHDVTCASYTLFETLGR